MEFILIYFSLAIILGFLLFVGFILSLIIGFTDNKVVISLAAIGNASSNKNK